MNQTKEKYKKVTEFAKLLPVFADDILNKELTVEDHSEITNKYRNMYLSRYISWCIEKPTNYDGRLVSAQGFVMVKLDLMGLFGVSWQLGYEFLSTKFEEFLSNTKVFFYDRDNTVLYFLPSECKEGLNKLNDWYLQTKQDLEARLKI